MGPEKSTGQTQITPQRGHTWPRFYSRQFLVFLCLSHGLHSSLAFDYLRSFSFETWLRTHKWATPSPGCDAETRFPKTSARLSDERLALVSSGSRPFGCKHSALSLHLSPLHDAFRARTPAEATCTLRAAAVDKETPGPVMGGTDERSPPQPSRV